MTAWVGLGSNLGPRRSVIDAALQAIDALPGTHVTGRSPYYRTAPWGDTDQPDFVNAVARLETDFSPVALLRELLVIEDQLGRVRHGRRWGPRQIDLDLLLYDDQQIATPELELPHPRMHERAFVLAPLADLDPDLDIPGRGPVLKCLQAVGSTGIERLDAASEE